MKKNNLIRRIGGMALLVTALAGCGSLPYDFSMDPSAVKLEKQFEERERIMKILGIKDEGALDKYLMNGYHSTIFGGYDLRAAAGLTAGTMKYEGDKNKFRISGNFSQYLQQETLDRVCEDADINPRDKIITDKEARDALDKTIRTRTK